MTVKDILLRELESLPQQRQEDVLAFVRFLKIGLADSQYLEERFVASVAQARKIAEGRGITERDIEEEIAAVRTERSCDDPAA